MKHDKPCLYVIAEKQYSNTTWYKSVMNGIEKEAARRSILICSYTKNKLLVLPSNTVVVLLGSSLPFITEYINICIQNKLRPVIAGFEIFQNNLQVSFITINRRQAMSDMVKKLILWGAGHIALLGVNSSIQTDMLRYEGWASVVKAYAAADLHKDVYYSNHGLFKCLNQFFDNYKQYDAVACTNDYYAAYLCAEAFKRGIHIPEDLMVTGFGNISLGYYTSPALTTVALNLSSVGIQVVSMFRNLTRNPDLLSCSATLQSQIIPRESTKIRTINLKDKIIVEENISSAFEPTFEKDLNVVYALENTIVNMDSIDQKIIAGLLSNTSYELLAEQLYLSDTAFKYRLQKLFHATGCQSKTDLIHVFQTFIPNFSNMQLT